MSIKNHKNILYAKLVDSSVRSSFLVKRIPGLQLLLHPICFSWKLNFFLTVHVYFLAKIKLTEARNWTLSSGRDESKRAKSVGVPTIPKVSNSYSKGIGNLQNPKNDKEALEEIDQDLKKSKK